MQQAMQGMHSKRSDKRTRRVIVAAVAAAVLLLVSVPTTYSYLAAHTDAVVNTFAGGAISLTLDEAQVDEDGQAIDDAARVGENTYTYVAGASYDKDPTVTVLAGSAECYVYVYVDNPLDANLFTLDYSDAWEVVATDGTATLYVYTGTVDAAEADVELEPIFTTVTVSEDLTADDVTEIGTQKITVQSYAVQADGLSADDAAALACSYFNDAYATSFAVEDAS